MKTFLLSLMAILVFVVATPHPVSAVDIKTAVPPVAGWNYQILDDEELEPAWSWTARLDATGPFETRVAFHYKDARNYLLLRVTGDANAMTLRFWRVVDGRVEQWGEPETRVSGPHGQLTIQRSSWRVRALWNGRAVVTAFSHLVGARFGTATRGATQLTAARMQPLEPVLQKDDFMRAQGPDDPETPGEWHRVAGIWKTSGALGPRANPTGNPNPFVFRAEVPATTAGANTATSTIGKWFWSDYTITASVRPMLRSLSTPLVAALAAYRQPDGSTIVGAVDFQTKRATIRLGQRVVASSAPFDVTPDQWHRVFLDPGPGTIRLLVNGVERVRASSKDVARVSTMPGALAQGEAALQATLGGGNFVDFDDVRIGPNQSITDNFEKGAVGRWEDILGAWQTRSAPYQDRLKRTAGPALTVTGEAEREEGLVEATFAKADPQTKNQATSYWLGVAFAVRDARNFFLARLRAGQLEIVERLKGSDKILAGGKALKTRTLPGITVEWREGFITARGAGTVVTATVPAIPEGRIGVWADGPANAIALTSFQALGAAPGWGESALPERFITDDWMKYWASNAAAWKKGTDGIWWHAGDFFQDAALSLPLPTLPPGAHVTLLLAANPAKPNLASQLVVKRAGDALTFTLSAGNRVLATTTQPYADPATATPSDKKEPQVRFVRRPVGQGQVALRVAVDGRVLISTITPGNGASAGTKVGVRLSSGIVASPRPVKVEKLAFNVPVKEREGKQPYIGVRITPLIENVEPEAKLPPATGVRIEGFEKDSPAMQAGLQLRDIISGADQRPITSVEALQEAIGSKPQGDTVALEVLRLVPDRSAFNWEAVQAGTTRLLDYTFTTQPVDWNASKGRWEIAERWTCQPVDERFGFFTGSNSDNPTLWSRFTVRGDFTLEAYVATPMDETRGERSPTDLNLTIGGDGRDLASGYSFLFAAKQRRFNRIVRGDRTVVEKPFVLPPVVGNNQHRDWFYVRVERRATPQGLRFRYSVNGQEIALYTDPHPLPGALHQANRLAFWTYNGGLSIARVRLWHNGIEAKDEGGSMKDETPAAVRSVATLKNALGEWRPRIESVALTAAHVQMVSDNGQRVLRIANPQSGGDWTLFVTRQPFDATQHPTLRFDYRVPAEVFVNLYAKVDGRWREIVFSGDSTRLLQRTQGVKPAPPGPAVNSPVAAGTTAMPILPDEVPLPIEEYAEPPLGRITGVLTDGQWHTATFDLVAALRQANLSTKVEALALAAPDREYLRAGLGGNYLGATYWIRDFQVPTIPNSDTPQPTVAATP
ncbi:MAG: PDZ domain-containing protein [Armatimonadota bacterium]|nr:PDZ domain-containing protein [Armatimonadota bacterium]